MREGLTYDYEVELISKDPNDNFETDSIGNPVGTPISEKIFCAKDSVTRTEFYKAASIGLKPSIVLIVHPYEYRGQTKIKFEGNFYRVVRTYDVDSENLELTCESIIADK
jgi:SPP1 family predicted phage head-tail adaptor